MADDHYDDDDDEEEFLLSQLLADDTTKHPPETSSLSSSSNENLLTEFTKEQDDDDDDDEEDESTITSTPSEDQHRRRQDSINDYYSQTMERLESGDPTLQSLELCNPMLWDFDRWRRPNNEENDIVVIDLELWLNGMARMLRLAQERPRVVQMNFMNIPLNHPILNKAVRELLTFDDRVWCQWSIENCDGFDPRYLVDAMVSAASSSHPCGTIRSLRIINSRLDLKGWRDVGRLVSTTIGLTELRITEILDSSAFVALCRGLAENKALTRLDFQGSYFKDDCFTSTTGVEALTRALQGLTSLRTLSFSYCGLYDHQLAMLIRAVSNSKTICWLDVSRNDCGLEACQTISSLLVAGDSTELRGLTLAGCGLGDFGLHSLKHALCMPECKLQHLDICDDRITDDGVVEFAKCWSSHTSLCSLWVSGNEMTTRGTKAILEAVKSNPGVTQVGLDTCLRHYAQIQYYALLNQGGRKLLQSDQHKVPLSLWPMVLERAQKVQHSGRHGSTVDILYHLLQGPALTE